MYWSQYKNNSTSRKSRVVEKKILWFCLILFRWKYNSLSLNLSVFPNAPAGKSLMYRGKLMWRVRPVYGPLKRSSVPGCCIHKHMDTFESGAPWRCAGPSMLNHTWQSWLGLHLMLQNTSNEFILERWKHLTNKACSSSIQKQLICKILEKKHIVRKSNIYMTDR